MQNSTASLSGLSIQVKAPKRIKELLISNSWQHRRRKNKKSKELQRELRRKLREMPPQKKRELKMKLQEKIKQLVYST